MLNPCRPCRPSRPPAQYHESPLQRQLKALKPDLEVGLIFLLVFSLFFSPSGLRFQGKCFSLARFITERGGRRDSARGCWRYPALGSPQTIERRPIVLGRARERVNMFISRHRPDHRQTVHCKGVVPAARLDAAGVHLEQCPGNERRRSWGLGVGGGGSVTFTGPSSSEPPRKREHGFHPPQWVPSKIHF